MSGFTAAGISPTTVTATQQAPLGFKLTVPNGDNGFQVYTYIKAAVNVLQGYAVQRAGTSTDGGYGACSLAIDDNNLRAVGVAQQANELDPASTGTNYAIPANYYGFVLTEGVGTVYTATAAAAYDTLVIHTTDGQLDDANPTATNGAVACVGGTAIGATSTGLALVKFAG
jgi:hypothetical protein|tara:strand:- start:242 stop:754 length:513 start_codon:yes stop_codon:yes gene_type:complete